MPSSPSSRTISGSIAPAFSRAAAPGASRSMANRRAMSMTRELVPMGVWSGMAGLLADVTIVCRHVRCRCGCDRCRPRRAWRSDGAACRWTERGGAGGVGAHRWPRLDHLSGRTGRRLVRHGFGVAAQRRDEPAGADRARGGRDAAAIGRTAGRAHLRGHARGDRRGIRRLCRGVAALRGPGRARSCARATMCRWPRWRGRCRTIRGR